MSASVFSLQTFEILAYAGRRNEAIAEFDKLLGILELNYGELRGVDFGPLPAGARDHDAHVLARLAGALTALFVAPEAEVTPQGFAQIVSWQRWIPAIFAAGPFASTDHVLRALNIDGTASEIRLDEPRLLRFCLFYGPESQVPLDIERLWAFNMRLAAALAFVLMSHRLLASPEAHGKREVLLRFLPARLEELGDIDLVPPGILHDVYMQCSYAEQPERHAIKAPINRLIRKKALELGYGDLDMSQTRGSVNGKPVLLVGAEWLTGNHSIFRTHSQSILALRRHFHVVGMATLESTDDAGRALFDEFVALPRDLRPGIETARAVAAERRPALIYYPSIGMFPLTIFLSNLRLAPVQVTALGHAATTQSPFIDYFAVEEDFVGDPATFSEKLILLPADAMPHVPSARAEPVAPVLREAPVPVRIAIAASIMKLNPRFLATLARIAGTAANVSGVPLQFVFLPGFARGVLYVQTRNVIWRYLPQALVNTELPYAQYMAELNSCDLFLNPFPYGNMNGIADTASLGLVGVCRSGPAVAEHIDEGMFTRLGLPKWLVARSDDDYVAAALRLATNHAERLALRRDLLARDAVQVFYRGRAELLGEKFRDLVAAPGTTAKSS